MAQHFGCAARRDFCRLGVCVTRPIYSTEDFLECQAKIGTILGADIIYCPIVCEKGVYAVMNAGVVLGDLDDLIFEETDGGPSQR